jgi:hypothetical protein
MPMKRVGLILAVVLSALLPASTALAITGYAGPKYWLPGQSGGSSYSSGWDYNAFNKPSSGFDTTVTFIDNVSYGWHETRRNRDMVTYTNWWSSQTKKAYCRANQGYHYGGCWVD